MYERYMYVTCRMSDLRGISVQYGDKYSALRPSTFPSAEEAEEGGGGGEKDREEEALPLLVAVRVALEEEGEGEGEELGLNPPSLLVLELEVGIGVEAEPEQELDVTRCGDPNKGAILHVEWMSEVGLIFKSQW